MEFPPFRTYLAMSVFGLGLVFFSTGFATYVENEASPVDLDSLIAALNSFGTHLLNERAHPENPCVIQTSLESCPIKDRLEEILVSRGLADRTYALEQDFIYTDNFFPRPGGRSSVRIALDKSKSWNVDFKIKNAEANVTKIEEVIIETVAWGPSGLENSFREQILMWIDDWENQGRQEFSIPPREEKNFVSLLRSQGFLADQVIVIQVSGRVRGDEVTYHPPNFKITDDKHNGERFYLESLIDSYDYLKYGFVRNIPIRAYLEKHSRHVVWRS